uniref:Uncharacterized protein n=1 Tax=Romanomermis culicivorax TaxID=13658 RepID=A0A915K4P0_ROMCU
MKKNGGTSARNAPTVLIHI